MATPVQPIDYATPPIHSKRPVTSVPWTITLSVIIVFFLTAVLGVIPHFEQIFKDFKTDLPSCTKIALEIARWASNDYGWIWLVLVPIIVPIVINQLTWRPMTAEESRIRALRMSVVCLFVVFLVFAATVIILLAPMISLIQSVSSPPRSGH